MARIDAFLKLGASQGCSDVHLAVGVPPMLRMNGELMPIKFRNLARGGARELRHRDPEHRRSRSNFRKGHDIDFSYVSEDGARFRVNVFRKDTGVGRGVPDHSDRGADARLAEPAAGGQASFCDYHQGMVLVTGSTGTGKSTTLAAMIDQLNRDAEAQHHQPRGPDRVRPPQQALAGDPARAAHPPAVLRRGRARCDARGPGRDPGGRAARRGHRALGDDRRRDRPPGARHAAHDQRGQDDRPHGRRAAGRGARADQELPLAEPDRRRDAGAGADARTCAAAGRSARSW